MPVVFNYRPRPNAGESFRGYLLRLTSENGFDSVSGVLALTGMHYALDTGAPWIRSSRTLMAALEPVLHLGPGELAKWFEETQIALEGLTDGQRRRVYRHGAAVCPACLKKEGYIRSLTDIAVLPVCPIHRVTLIESCPDCGEQISFNRSELDQCPACESRYSDAPVKSLNHSDPVAFICRQVYLGKLLVENVLAACDRMARPFDILPAAPTYAAMGVDQLCEHLHRAAGLLYSEDYRESYRSELLEELADLNFLSPSAPTLPFDQFVASTGVHSSKVLGAIDFKQPDDLTVWAGKSVKPVEDAARLGIEASRLRSWNQQVESVELSKQISAELLAKTLGVTQQDLFKLNEAGILCPQNDVRTARHQIFALSDVTRLIQSIPKVNSSSADSCTIGDLKKELKLFGADYSVLVALILDGKIPATENIGVFTTMTFDRDKARKALHTHLVSTIEINGDKLAGIMATTTRQLLEAKGQWKRGVSGDFQRGALKTWCSLNRVVKMTGKQLRQLRPALERCNIQPAFIVPGAPQDLLVYTLDQNFREAISTVVLKEKYSGF